MFDTDGIWGYIIGGFGGLLLGYFLTFHVGADHLDYIKYSKAWPSTEGVVTHSEVKEHVSSEGKSSYRYSLQYNYMVKGRAFSDSDISHSQDLSFSKKHKAVELQTQYPVGSPIIVHYDPLKPSDALLDVSSSISDYSIFSLGIIFFITGALILLNPIFNIFGLIAGFFGVKEDLKEMDDHFRKEQERIKKAS